MAIDLASRIENSSKIRCLMVENTFTSIPEVAKSLFQVKLVRCMPKWMYKNQFMSRVKVPRLTVPVLYLSGTGDQLIPPSMMSELFNSSASEVKLLARFPGGSHNETWMSNHYYQTIEYFFDEVRDKLVFPLILRFHYERLIVNLMNCRLYKSKIQV